jgi:spermidine synthase
MKRRLSLALLLLGFTMMSSQIVLMRELLIVFYGNEISIGIILANWLFWGALGSWGLGRFADRIKERISFLSLGQILLALLVPLSVGEVRLIKLFLRAAPGEIIGLSPMFYSTLLILAPICLVLGFLFALACRIYPSGSRGAGKIGSVYILEAIGATAGGLLTSFLLIRILGSFGIVFLLSLFNLLSCFSLSLKRKLAFQILILILIGGAIFSFVKQDYLSRLSLRFQWRGYNLLTSENSIYGNITVTRRDSQHSFFSNGLLIFTFPDRLSAEEVAHFPLLSHPSPERVLLIGGGQGALGEILKHPVEKVDYVELDPLVIELGRKYLPLSFNSKVKVSNVDGRLFVRKSKDEYEVIIVNLPDPFTAQLNRFYTLQFFREAKNILSPDGLLSLGVTSSENYISGELQKFLSCIYKTLKEVFPEVKVIPGDYDYFLASKKEGILTDDYRVLMKRLKEREISAQYVREYYLFSKLSRERINYRLTRLREEKSARINRDFQPICYYYDMVLWATYFKTGMQKIFRGFSERKIWGGLCLIYFLIILPVFFFRRKAKPACRQAGMRAKSCLVAIATTGFAEITFQVVVIISFQILYGYIYYKLGIILTSFMIGLALGGWWATRILGRLKDDFGVFIKTQITICIYPLILPLILWTHPPVSLFSFLPVIAGFIGGFQFPLANKIYLGSEEEIGRVAGLTYGIDLVGSCLGALLASAFLLPILGIPKTCLAVAFLNMASLLLLVSKK